MHVDLPVPIAERRPYQVAACVEKYPDRLIGYSRARGIWKSWPAELLSAQEQVAASNSLGTGDDSRAPRFLAHIVWHTAADPDLNLVEEVNQPRPLRVSLRGAWRLLEATGTVCAWHLPDATENVRILSAGAAETVLEILCRHGASYDVSLARC